MSILSILIWIAAIIVYLVIGRILGEKAWERMWDEYGYPLEAGENYNGMVLGWTFLWPLGVLWIVLVLFWRLIELIASIFIDL